MVDVHVSVVPHALEIPAPRHDVPPTGQAEPGGQLEKEGTSDPEHEADVPEQYLSGRRVWHRLKHTGDPVKHCTAGVWNSHAVLSSQCGLLHSVPSTFEKRGDDLCGGEGMRGWRGEGEWGGEGVGRTVVAAYDAGRVAVFGGLDDPVVADPGDGCCECEFQYRERYQKPRQTFPHLPPENLRRCSFCDDISLVGLIVESDLRTLYVYVGMWQALRN